MKEVVGQVIADVSENAAAVDCDSYIPVPIENGMSELPEWCREHYKQGWRHDKPVFVHREVVMNAM